MATERENSHILISGRVQGVGYRYFARLRVELHNVTGYVRNLPDGSVEVVAEGSRVALEQFIRDSVRGPNSGNVSDCQVNWRPVSRQYRDFTINY